MQLTNQDLAEFNSEAIELIDAAERQLLEIGSGGDFKIAFDLVFRCFHNMKGGAGWN
jgi:chemotaxis protein histidine kinase CheA